MEAKACALHAAAGRVEFCPGDACVFWEPGGAVVEGGCVLERLDLDFLRRPDLADLLLDVRRRLEAAEGQTNRKGRAMNHILIATDGSPAAGKAVELGLELAREHEAEVTFVHVVPDYGLDTLEPDAALREAAAVASEQGVACKVELLVGDPANEIVALADTLESGLIVLGCRGLGVVKSALLGSVSHTVLAHTKRPVLIVRSPLRVETPEPEETFFVSGGV